MRIGSSSYNGGEAGFIDRNEDAVNDDGVTVDRSIKHPSGGAERDTSNTSDKAGPEIAVEDANSLADLRSWTF